MLGAHPAYGPSEVFILPRGSGGRTPTITQTDLHIGYDHLLTERERIGVFVDLINLFNQREITNVDDNYTYSPVKALVDDAQPRRNSKWKPSMGVRWSPTATTVRAPPTKPPYIFGWVLDSPSDRPCLLSPLGTIKTARSRCDIAIRVLVSTIPMLALLRQTKQAT